MKLCSDRFVIESVKSQIRSKPSHLRQAARGTGRIYNVAGIFGGLYYIIECRGAGVAQNDTDTNPTIRYECGDLAANSVRPFWRALSVFQVNLKHSLKQTHVRALDHPIFRRAKLTG